MADRLPELPSLNSRLDSSLDPVRLLDPMWIAGPSLADWILHEVFVDGGSDRKPPGLL